jgi:SSS family solute:Na+ symporter
MALSLFVYVVVSLLTSRGRTFDMDRMLHRGRHAVAGELRIAHARGSKPRSRAAEADPLAEPGAPAAVDAGPVKGWKVLGMGREFTPFDKVIYIATYAWTLSWVVVFIVGTALNLTETVGTASWTAFWKTYIYVYLGTSIVVILWFSTGGFINLKSMIRQLKTMTRDHGDSGFVEKK